MDNLNFYKHKFFGSPDGEVQQRINLFDSKSPGIFEFLQILEGGTGEDELEEDDDNFTVWILRQQNFDKKTTILWKGNLTQSVLDGVVKDLIK